MKNIHFILLLLVLLQSFAVAETLAIVNGHKITEDILSNRGYSALSKSQKDALLKQLINEELLISYLLQQDFVKSSEFEKVFNEQKELAQQAIKTRTGKSLSKDQIRKIKGFVAIELYKQKLFHKVKVTDEEIKNYFDSHREQFSFPDSIEIADIITKTSHEAQAIIKNLKNSKNLEQDFINEAKKHHQNGYLGWFSRDNAPEHIFVVAYNSEVRTLIPHALKTKHGYNVVYLLNKKPAGKISFKEAKASIEKFLKQQKVAQELEKKVDTLSKKADIYIFQ